MLDDICTIARRNVDEALDPESIARFHATGFLSVEHMTDLDDIADLRRVAVDLFARRAGFAEGSWLDLVGRPSDEPGVETGASNPARTLPQILDPRSLAPSLLRSRFYPRAARIARDLLGPKCRFKTDHILLKPARHGARTPWHQDDAFRDPRLVTTEISIWLPLQDVDDRNGCLRFISGSHRGGLREHRPLGGDRRAHGLETVSDFDRTQSVACPLAAGGCTIHGGLTVHGADPNFSDRPRYAYVLVFELPPRWAPGQASHPWLEGRDTDPERRRRAWMRRGGFVTHGARRLRQLRHVGLVALLGRVWRKLALR